MKIAVRASRTMTRRTMLGTLGVIALAAASGTLTPPRRARAQPLGLNESLDEAMTRVVGSPSLKDGGGLIKLDIPPIAENGAVGPRSVRGDPPRAPTSYVQHRYLG